MNPPRPDDSSTSTVVAPPADSVLAVLDFEPRRFNLRPLDLVRYTLYSLLIVALAATTGYLVANRAQPVYGARSEILFERRTENSTGFLREDRDLTTQLVTLRTRAVLGPVASANGLSIDDLAKKLHVGIVESSEVLRIQVDDRSRTRAKSLVGAISKQYIGGANSPASGETQRYLEDQLTKVSSETQRLSVRSAELERGRLRRASGGNQNPIPTPEQTLVDAEIKSLLDQRTELNGRLEAVNVDFINRPRVAQITKPYAMDSPVSPKPLNTAVAGALAGVVVAAIAVAALARRRGQTVRST